MAARRLALRNVATKRRDAERERRNLAPTTSIVAHEKIENSKRVARTAFPTAPVCWNAVQSSTAFKVARRRATRAALHTLRVAYAAISEEGFATSSNVGRRFVAA